MEPLWWAHMADCKESHPYLLDRVWEVRLRTGVGSLYPHLTLTLLQYVQLVSTSESQVFRRGNFKPRFDCLLHYAHVTTTIYLLYTLLCPPVWCKVCWMCVHTDVLFRDPNASIFWPFFFLYLPVFYPTCHLLKNTVVVRTYAVV